MLVRLHAHREWANKRSIEWMPTLPEPDEYCHKMISHILLSEAMWLLRLHGGSDPEISRVITNWESFPLNELALRSVVNNSGWKNVLQSDLSRRVRFTRFAGEESESIVSDIATHVCTHGVYHRGQIAAQAARLGLHAPPTDFIVYSRLFPE